MKKSLAFLLCVVLLVGIWVPAFGAPDETAVVKLNGEPLQFDVDPVILNGRTLVPMRAIFEALGCDVFWDDETQTATGVRNGKAVSVTIGSTAATVAGTPLTIDQPPILKDDRTLVPLRFISEAYGSKVDWDEANHTVSITADKVPFFYYYLAANFDELGTWKMAGDHMQGLATGSTGGDAAATGAQPATVQITVKEPGTYRLWVNARDYETNQPGKRFFHAGIDGTRSDVKLGAHGQEGFRWTDTGTFALSAGPHTIELYDTSGFYARCAGVLLSQDTAFVPSDDPDELAKTCMPYDPFQSLPSAQFPTWAKQDISAEKTASIENDAVKIVFYQGQGEQGSLVQNEILVKDNGSWVPVKKKTEELGYLMMSASASEFAGISDVISQYMQTVQAAGKEQTMSVADFYRSGVATWFIPSDFTKSSDSEILLTFPASPKADLTVTFSLDALADDPKVTLNATFPEKGAYSFLLYSGDAVKYEAFDTVTAPLLYVKKAIPEALGGIVPECFLFTPMMTLHFPADNQIIPGKELTSGVVVDPTYVNQSYCYPDTSKFGITFKSPTGDVRSQIVAPLFGTEHCRFEAGQSTSISYRIVNQLSPWFDTFEHITQDLYSLSDIRQNYFHSVNEAIYNATDLMMDDDYGGWDDNAMSFYNMEGRELTTTANSMAIIQRYLLTENEDFLDQRAIPTLAYMLGRKSFHFKPVDVKGGSDGYASQVPSPIGSPVAQFGVSVYGGLYEMTQGRVPALMDFGLNNVSTDSDINGITAQTAMYKYTGNQLFLDKVKELADDYLNSYPGAEPNREARFINGFIYGDYINMTTAFLTAYEVTKEQKYLDAAQSCAQLLMTGIWTTGYQNDYATNEYTIDPDKTMERVLYADNYTFWWHGDKQWRLGNVDGQAKKAQDLPRKIPEETVPGWLLAKAGMGTEHTATPGHGNVITMNNWAGNMVKLSQYTGEPYYEMQARNAILGRFGNYAGYYQDRNIVHQMKADYPYTGPDFTSIYWHHIPSFVSMLEDFLINQVWAKSKQNITFASDYQLGYAYFASNQFGFAPGKFYDQNDMWLWLDRGIIQPDSVNIDYIAARKDGVLGLALMNEGNDDLTTTIQLGEKVPGGAGFTGTATVYDADGNKSALDVTNGQFTLTIPSKGIRSLVLNIPGVKTPGFAKTYQYSNELGQTVSEHTRGKGYVLQLNDDNYYAYVYATDMAADTKAVKLTYQMGDQSYTAEKSTYPFEFLIKVDDPTKAFTYSLEAVSAVNGLSEKLGGGTLRPLSQTNPPAKLTVPEKTLADAASLHDSPYGDQPPFVPNVKMAGYGGSNIRIVAFQDSFPVPLAENNLRGLKLYGIFKHKTEGSVRILDTMVTGNEMRDNGEVVLLCKPTGQVPFMDYSKYDIQIALAGVNDGTDLSTVITPETMPVASPMPEQENPGKQLGTFPPFEITYSTQGVGGGVFRFPVSLSQFPFPVTENSLKGLRITGTFTNKEDGSVLEYDAIISGNEMRADSTVVLAPGTTTVPVKDYDNYKKQTHTIKLTIHPAP